MNKAETARNGKDTRALFLALELGRREWKLGFGTGPRQMGQIPAKCRDFTGRTHDLPYFSGKHAGPCRDLLAQ
jgi:hypothetical protein